VKGSLNDLARKHHLYRIGDEISIHPPTAEDDNQIELNLDFNQEFVRLWNKTFEKELNKGYVLTDTLSGEIKNRLDSFSKDDLVASIKKWRDFCEGDEWWSKKPDLMVNLMRFLQKEERIQQALNFKKVGGDFMKPRDEKEDSSLLN
jgi:hypothetical protein